MAINKPDASESVQRELQEAASEIMQLGGTSAFVSGEWLFHFIQRTYRKYADAAAAESHNYAALYPGRTREQIAELFIKGSCRKAAMAGAVTGLAVSTDEVIGLFTAGEGVVGLPANIAIAAGAICAEVFFTAKIQLQLVARLAALYGASLDPEQPDDLLTIMSFAFWGGATEVVSKELAKTGGEISRAMIGRYYAKKESYAVLKRLAKRMGYRIFRRSLVNAIVPGVSMFMGAWWNKRTTRAVGKRAMQHFTKTLQAPAEPLRLR